MTEPTAPAVPSGRTTSARSKARKRALDILFEAELRGTDTLETLAQRSEDADPPVRDYTRVLVEGVSEHGHEIDARISASLAPRVGPPAYAAGRPVRSADRGLRDRLPGRA